jgi:drug/metabolite transporter (DMT)-like permease
MELFAFLAVLFAAALHASWNAVVKGGLDRFMSIVLISLGAGAVSLVALPFFPVPGAAAWPWLLLSVVLHVGYKMFLVMAYRAGDLGQVYSIARGTAPLLVCGAMFLFFDEALTPSALAGVFVLVSGVWLMCVRGGHSAAGLQGRAVGFALVTSAFIASYTITDGIGARANGAAHGYAVWMFFLDTCLMLAVLLARRGGAGLKVVARNWTRALGGGLMMVTSYWIIIWAMTVAPIAMVSALRESSVLFATLISVVILKERLTRWRAVAAVAIVAGILLTRIA